jgi:hypothetical protein
MDIGSSFFSRKASRFHPPGSPFSDGNFPPTGPRPTQALGADIAAAPQNDHFAPTPLGGGAILHQHHPNLEKVKRVTNAFLKMKKLDIAALRRAYEGQ